ncbi:MAG: HepT-like ribonuclease domain-containing protein [Glycocaulis sp.]|mgnify:CR=1 FL=1
MDAKTRLYLLDMLGFANSATAFLGDADASALSANPEKFYAVRHAVELVGEAARRVPEADRKQLPAIAWNEAIGMRNHIAHAYHAVDPVILVNTIRNHFPGLVAAIQSALRELDA